MRWWFFGLCLSGCVVQPVDVTIHRDTWGVPHIYADKEEAGYYGLGYAQAEDQLEMILGSILWMQGRLAEIQGQDLLEQDVHIRRWQHLKMAEQGFKKLSPQLQKNYQYFVAGLNRYLADHPEQKPAWAPTLKTEHFVGLSRALNYAAYAAVEGPQECGLNSVGSVAEKGASNGWVLAPEKTKMGATVVLADPHLEFASFAYYEYRIEAGGLKSAGFALGPLLWQANNRHVAWALTTGNPDMWDCYQVAMNKDNRYQFDSEWKELIQYEEEFQVLGGDTQTRTLEYTQHNGLLSPVIARNNKFAYAVSTSQMADAGLWDEEIYQMNHAASVNEVREAMQIQGSLPQNVIVGDALGNILYVRAGRTPERPPGFDWSAAVPGNTSASAWKGYLAFSDLVQLQNPVELYLQNNNVAPDAMYPTGTPSTEKLVSTIFSSEAFNDVPGRITSRGLRTLEIFESKKRLDLNDIFALVFDEKWIATEAWQIALKKAIDRFPEGLPNDDARAMLAFIQSFDGFARKSSVAALHFYYFRRGLAEVFSRPEFNQQKSFPWDDDDFSDGFLFAILKRVANASAEMRQELGDLNVPLGEVFRVGRGGASWPLGGETISMDSIPNCVAAYSPLCERTMRAFASHGFKNTTQRLAYRGSNSMRVVVFSKPIQAYSLHVYGQNNNPKSPHYDDQAQLLSDRLMKPVWFERDQLEGHIESVLKLTIDEFE